MLFKHSSLQRPSHCRLAPGAQDYSVDDILNHFNPPAVRDVGGTRGLTIGGGDKDGDATRGVTIGASGFDNGDAKRPEGTTVAAADEPSAFNLSVTFALDSDRLTGRAQRNLKVFADALKRPELADRRFAVEGHTDDSGTAQHNMGLSERRAMAVVRYLVSQGVDRQRLAPAGYGETRPLRAGASHPDNRRVETREIR